jgi:hypothetical protein
VAGEFTEKTLHHEGNAVREFYSPLEGPWLVIMDHPRLIQRDQSEIKRSAAEANKAACLLSSEIAL